MKFKFYVVPIENKNVRYQHECVSLCEGLQELGYEFYGTDNYWYEPEINTYLIKKAPDDFQSDGDVYTTFYFKAFPDAINKVDYSKINVLIDREDGLYGEYTNKNYRKFDLILRTHYNKNINYNYYHRNIRPWAFGLSNRIINTIDIYANTPIEDKIFVNFRLSHDVRTKAIKEMLPILSKKYQILNTITINFDNKNPLHCSERDKLYWIQSGYRHDTTYYKLLNTSLFTFAFGGFIYIKPFATNRIVKQMQYFYKAFSILLRKLKMDDSKCYFIDQFDSWRLWESFYANTCPIHMDFDYWNWILPVTPINKVHYWGISGFNFKQSAEEILSLTKEDILKIAKAGRKWVINNYSPKATALRFIELLKEM
jgi:hypothetical protein